VTRSLVLAALLALHLAPAAQAAAPVVLRAGLVADLPTLDPQFASGTVFSGVMADLFTGLLARDAASKPVPGCAESWSVSEDRLAWTFRLRPNLVWSDGAPLTSTDFVFAFRRLMDPKTASPLAGQFAALAGGREVLTGKLPPERLGVEAPDPRTVVLRLVQPVPYLPDLLAIFNVAPLPEHALVRDGADWLKAGRLVGNGAYVLAERRPQSFVRLVKNPRFHAADTVRIDEVQWHPTPDLNTAFQRYRAGELDMIQSFAPEKLAWVQENIPEALHMVAQASTYMVALNLRRKPLDDVRVRKALFLALDREAIAGKVLGAGTLPAWSYIGSGFEGYPRNVMAEEKLPLAERQQLARRLLAEAGYGAGNELVLPYTFDSQEENRRIFVAVASNWQAIGVRAEANALETGMYFQKIRANDYVVARFAQFSVYGDPYGMLQPLASQAPNNWAGYANPAYDELLARSNRAADPTERNRLMASAEQLLMADYPVVTVYHQVTRRLISPRVKGWVDTPRGTTPTRYLSIGL
jgi:oligopeptide transport system substrate-binding protein